MKDTTTIRLRPDRQAPRPPSQEQLPEAAGTHAAETPIYAELATEWLGRGRTLPALSAQAPEESPPTVSSEEERQQPADSSG